MNPSRLLREYKREREILLDKILSQLRNDPRITTAWLAGSLGRGDDDELSDLDLWVVVKNEQISQLVSQRRDYAAQIGIPILFVDAPQNAPFGGGFLDACYEAPVAPQLVDWNWQPQSLAFLPGQIELLFDRVGLARRDDPVQLSNQTASDELLNSPIHFISFFWMMLLVTAKTIARQSPQAEEVLNITRAPFRQTVDFIHLNSSSSVFPVPDYARNESFKEKLSYLRLLAQKMKIMMDRVSELGYSIPDKIVPGAFRYLDMIDHLI